MNFFLWVCVTMVRDTPSAQTVRRGGVGPVRSLLGGKPHRPLFWNSSDVVETNYERRPGRLISPRLLRFLFGLAMSFELLPPRVGLLFLCRLIVILHQPLQCLRHDVFGR